MVIHKTFFSLWLFIFLAHSRTAAQSNFDVMEGERFETTFRTNESIILIDYRIGKKDSVVAEPLQGSDPISVLSQVKSSFWGSTEENKKVLIPSMSLQFWYSGTYYCILKYFEQINLSTSSAMIFVLEKKKSRWLPYLGTLSFDTKKKLIKELRYDDFLILYARSDEDSSETLEKIKKKIKTNDGALDLQKLLELLPEIKSSL